MRRHRDTILLYCKCFNPNVQPDLNISSSIRKSRYNFIKMSTCKLSLGLLLILTIFINIVIAPPPPQAPISASQAQPLHQPTPQLLSSSVIVQRTQIQTQHQQHLPTNPYIKSWSDLLLELRQQMLTKSMKFDESFRHLLSESKKSLHNMFLETYGMLYHDNTEIFTSMFESLEQYYANGQVKLTKSMETFFERLYRKIFQVFNINKTFTQAYLECATEQLAHLKPFKDVPDKLIGGIRHAFVAARTYVQALNSGIDVIRSIVTLNQPAQCNLIQEKLLKNTQVLPGNNQHNINPVKLPCLSFCEQVMTKCIGRNYLEQLNDRWRSYVMALDELALKLSTSYNIETIIAPLDVQISEAIMNFQENGSNITQQVYMNCATRTSSAMSAGSDFQLSPIRPMSNNKLIKRAANYAPNAAAVIQNNHQYTSHNRHSPHTRGSIHQPMNGVQNSRMPKGRAMHSNTPLLLEDLTSTGQKSPLLIDEIRNYMLSTRTFWATLPNSVCTSNITLGLNASATKNQKNPNCLQENSFQLLDLNSDLRYRVEIQQQINNLDAMRQKIESALAGNEIEWNAKSERYPYGRVPAPTTTTTTTTPEPEAEEPGDDDTADNDYGGSGDGPTESEGLEADTTIPDDYDDTTIDEGSDADITSQSPTASSGDTVEPSNTDDNIKNDPTSIPEIPSNEIGSFLVPPEQPGAQRSSQTSSRLVINMEVHILLASLLSVALLIVTRPYFSNQLTILPKQEIR